MLVARAGASDVSDKSEASDVLDMSDMLEASEASGGVCQQHEIGVSTQKCTKEDLWWAGFIVGIIIKLVVDVIAGTGGFGPINLVVRILPGKVWVGYGDNRTYPVFAHW